MEEETRLLRMPYGTDEVTYATSKYPVDLKTGLVRVPAVAVGPLLERGGAVYADEQEMPIPEGFVRVKHGFDKNATLSHRGDTYEPDENGILTVPMSAADHIDAHGFAMFIELEPTADELTEQAERNKLEQASAVDAALGKVEHIKEEAEGEDPDDDSAPDADDAAPDGNKPPRRKRRKQ